MIVGMVRTVVAATGTLMNHTEERTGKWGGGWAIDTKYVAREKAFPFLGADDRTD